MIPVITLSGPEGFIPVNKGGNAGVLPLVPNGLIIR